MKNLRLKIKKYYKIKCDTSLKRYDHAEFKSGDFDLYFGGQKNQKINCDTSLKRYDHAEFKSDV